MTPERPAESLEQQEEMYLAPPAIELLLDPERAKSTWPERVTSNEAFMEQQEARKILVDRLDTVISRLPRPDISLQTAVAENILTETQVTNLYESLGGLLNDPDYERAALYMPFEFLPDTTKKFATEKLRDSSAQFKDAYMGAWKSLLSIHDVRANFVDGDIPESEYQTGDSPRVVKAAHLIPKLVEQNLMSVAEVISLMETTDDEILRQSIADTLPVLMDMGLIPDRKIDSAKAPNDIKAPNVAISKNRAAWLEQKVRENAIDAASNDVRRAIMANALAKDAAAKYEAPEADTATQQTYIEGIRKSIEETMRADADSGKALYATYQDTLLSFWKRDIPETREALAKTFFRLNGLGVVSSEQLRELGLNRPSLAGPFSENLQSMDAEVQDTQKIVAAIESDPELLRQLYPVALMYGSRLKGYGTENSDTDIGVIIRPDTPIDDREKLQTMLGKIFADTKELNEASEFWLEEIPEGLGVRDFENPDATQGEKSWTHMLFGAAWEGDENAIRELREKLLVPYFYETEQKLHGRDARGIYLEAMERSTLQYRLMHKGYERFFPSYGGIHTPHADRIDGKSTFWDSGYRQTAIKLFANRVFLPKLSPIK